MVQRLRQAGCVFAEREAQLLRSSAATPAELDALVERRAAGLPLEQVLGWAEFYGMRVAVDPGVFVPRRRTELLVREAARLATRLPGTDVVAVDLCCGSGAVGAALVAALAAAGRTTQLHATDIDPAAVRCAARNLAPYGGRVHAGDLDSPLPAALRGRCDLVLANAPYVPTGAIGSMPPEARVHEPITALDGGTDGLDVHRRLAAAAPRWLRRGGHLLIETSRPGAEGTAGAVAAAGLTARIATSRRLDATVVVGTLR